MNRAVARFGARFGARLFPLVRGAIARLPGNLLGIDRENEDRKKRKEYEVGRYSFFTVSERVRRDSASYRASGQSTA